MKQTLTLIALGASLAVTAIQPVAAQDAAVRTITFNLAPNPSMLACISDGSGTPPSASVTVTRGKQNDSLSLKVSHIKPGLGFDLFTVQRSNLLSNGTVDPGFKNFGLAWYQSDLDIGQYGTGTASVRSVLLDQIFGFDPDVALSPTNTFHVGFWFDNPNDAAPCGFNPATPTPFNGTHNAGPVAMISVPNATTDLGPLCTKPNLSTSPASCRP